jgi:nucleoside-diphosphate-sugar epimerase
MHVVALPGLSLLACHAFPNLHDHPLLQAEKEWLCLHPEVSVHVFRLAGIYGPGRSALDTVRKDNMWVATDKKAQETTNLLSETRQKDARQRGTAVGLEGESQGSARPRTSPAETKWISRVHVRDICECIMASMERPCAGAVYNVADDEPAPRHVVMSYARQVCAPGPPQVLVHFCHGELPGARVTCFWRCS